MDPLSITASAITLVDAATTIYRFFDSVRHADKGFAALCIELRTLTGFLKSIDKTHEDFCRNPLSLVSVDRELWEQSKIALDDCQRTLDQLANLIERIRGPSRSNANLLRRTKLATNLYVHSRDVVGFRDKIHMSNISLQTILQVINLSLSLRQNASQEMILKALHALNEHLKESDRAASDRHATSFLDPADRYIVANLKGLVRAAQSFHSNASSTAGSIRGGRRQHRNSIRSLSGYAESALIPKIPSIKKRQIEMFLTTDRPPAQGDSNSVSDANIDLPPIIAYPDLPEVAEPKSQIAFDINFDNMFSIGLSKLAQKSILDLNFPESEKTLKQALECHKAAGLDDLQHRHLRAQLALCMLLQGNGQQAEDLILDLIEFRVDDDVIADHLLYALALAQIHDCNFGATIGTCKRLWQAIRRAGVPTNLHGHDIFRLLAVSYRESGSELLARALEEVHQELNFYAPLPTVGQFIANCNDLLAELCGFDKGVFVPSLFSHQIQQLAVWNSATTLQERLAKRSKVHTDIAMNMVETRDKFLADSPGSAQRFITPRTSDKRSSRRHVLKRASSLFSRTPRASHSGSTEEKASSIPRSQSLNVQERTHQLQKSSSQASNESNDDKFKDATVAVLSSAALILTFPVSLPVFLYRQRRRRRPRTAANDHVSWIPQEIHEVDAQVLVQPYPEIKERFSFEGFPATPSITPAVLPPGEPYWQQHFPWGGIRSDPEKEQSTSFNMVSWLNGSGASKLPDCAEMPDFRWARFEMEDTSMRLIERKLNETSEAMIPQRESCVGNATTPNTVALTSSRSLEDMYGTNDHHVTEHPVSPHWDSGYESGSSMSCKEGDSMCDSLGNGVLPFVQGEGQPNPPDQAHQVYRPYRPCRPSQLCVGEACRIEDVFRNHDPPGIPTLPLWIEEKLKGTLTGNSEG